MPEKFSVETFLKNSQMTKEDLDDIITKIVEKHPIELEQQIPTLDKPLIIECACPGWQPRQWPPASAYPVKKPPGFQEGGVRYPAVPSSIEDQVREIVEATKAGCSVAHIHPRDPQDGLAVDDVEILAEIYDRILDEVDVVSIQHTWRITENGTIDYLDDARKLLAKAGGNRYCQGAVVLWPPANSYPPNYAKAAVEAVKFMKDNNIAVVHKFRGTYHVRQMTRTLLDTGLLAEDEPLVLIHDMGHPFGWPMDLDPWMPIEMIISIIQTKQRMPNSVIGVASGGRNWLPITMTAILAGVDFVRVGIEDCYWMYPHRDKVIEKNMEAVGKIVDFCTSIDRNLAGVAETRQMLGITRTS